MWHDEDASMLGSEDVVLHELTYRNIFMYWCLVPCSISLVLGELWVWQGNLEGTSRVISSLTCAVVMLRVATMLGIVFMVKRHEHSMRRH